jgi:hypothetical protein
MECKQCGGERVANVGGKCSDLFGLSLGEIDKHSIYVPGDWGIGGGDYIDFNYCLDCGQIQGTFPLEVTELEMEAQDSDDE